MNRYKSSVVLLLILLFFGFGFSGSQKYNESVPVLKTYFDISKEDTTSSGNFENHNIKPAEDDRDLSKDILNSLEKPSSDEPQPTLVQFSDEEFIANWRKSGKNTPPFVSDNPNSKFKYEYGTFGEEWKDELIDASSYEWWINYGDKFKKTNKTIYSDEFIKLHKELQNEQDEKIIAEKLRSLCAKYYPQQDREDNEERKDIFYYCRQPKNFLKN